MKSFPLTITVLVALILFAMLSGCRHKRITEGEPVCRNPVYGTPEANTDPVCLDRYIENNP